MKKQEQKNISKEIKPQPKPQNQQKKVEIAGITVLGKKVIISGVCLLVIGFFILSKTDPEGQNWASVVSPFLIIGAYIIIAIGIITPEHISQKSEKNNT